MKKQYLECGKIVSPHGIRGEVRLQPWCDNPGDLCDFETLYLKKGQVPLVVERARVNKNMVLLKLQGIEDRESAVTLRGSVVYIDREDAPEEEGVFFVQDLLGLDVQDADTGQSWGRLTDVFPTGAHDVYETTDSAGVRRLFPAIEQVVLEINLQAGAMRIRPLPGLFEQDEEGDSHAH